MSIFNKHPWLKIPQYGDFKATFRVVIFTSILFLILLIWQAFSSINEHHKYQLSMMNSVTENVLTDYQEYLTQLRLEIDLFQQRHKEQINNINTLSNKSTVDDYMPILDALKRDIKHTRLFAIIDENGNGILKHITGDFLPACSEEVASTVSLGTQEHMFLHHSKSSVHFDLLQPLVATDKNKRYFFTAFNPDILKALLIKYQLPHQQLFLMRTDNIGKVELTTDISKKDSVNITMSAKELSSFSYVKKIPRTRWQVAIRLSPSYNTALYRNNIMNALLIWGLLTAFIYIFYRMQKSRLLKQEHIERELIHQGTHDRLTGLANRESFESDLVKLLQQKLAINEQQEYGAVIHIDIDQFQVINNTYGYSTGDKILFQLSLALKELLPEDATICRLGNDEFGIIFPTLFHSALASYSDKVRVFIQNIDISHIQPNASLHASIGAMNLDGSQYDAAEVLSALNICIRLAKEKGRNRVQTYQSGDKELQQHANEINMLHELSKAIHENEVLLYRQEIRPLAMQTNKHYEVLMRLKNAEGDIVSPNIIIPAAEKYGLIKALDQAIIIKTFSALCKNSDDTASYSINLSGATITDSDTASFIEKSIIKYDIDPSRLFFEVTETAAIAHVDSAIAFINRLTKIGCRFALDDFGSGASSFSYLQQLPISVIKIDGMFVKDIDHNPINRIFVESIQKTAYAMNKKTVAEFVENEAIAHQLKLIGVDYIQGYYIHKPEPWITH